jgi:hypothetical protein
MRGSAIHSNYYSVSFIHFSTWLGHVINIKWRFCSRYNGRKAAPPITTSPSITVERRFFRSVRLGDRQDHRKILNFRGSSPSIVPLLHDNKSPLAPLIVSTHQLDLLKQCSPADQAVSCVQLVQRRGCRSWSAVGELRCCCVRTWLTARCVSFRRDCSDKNLKQKEVQD